MKYTAKLRSCGNPDHGQYTPVSNPQTVESDTPQGIVTAASAYIVRWNLGGGNWPTIVVRCDGRPFAVISYNGRLWKHSNRSEEILCAS